MAANAPKIVHSSVGATADVFYLSQKCKQVVIRNTHATQTLYAKVKTGASAAAANTAATNDAAVASANDNFLIKAGETRTIFKSTRMQFVAVSLIGSGAATTFSMEGTNWVDGN